MVAKPPKKPIKMVKIDLAGCDEIPKRRSIKRVSLSISKVCELSHFPEPRRIFSDPLPTMSPIKKKEDTAAVPSPF